MFRQIWRPSTTLICKRFAGHSKWANIKHAKGLKDAEKSSLFSKFARLIRVAIQEGGSTNPLANAQLKSAIDQALSKDVPMSMIEKNIKRFNPDEAQIKKGYVEIKTMSKVFLIVECISDNLARVKNDVNTAIRKTKTFGTAAADIKSWFDEMGVVVATSKENFANLNEFEDKLTEDAINCDAEEVDGIDLETKSATFICMPRDIERVKRSLMNLGYVIEDAQHIFSPKHVIQITDEERKNYDSLIQRLKTIDGVEQFYDNVEQVE